MFARRGLTNPRCERQTYAKGQDLAIPDQAVEHDIVKLLRRNLPRQGTNADLLIRQRAGGEDSIWSGMLPWSQCALLIDYITLALKIQYSQAASFTSLRRRGIIFYVFLFHESKTMARNRSSKSSSKRRRSASQIALYVISVIIVLSMAVGFVLSVLPTPTEQQTVVTPTPIILVTPTPTPTSESSTTPTSTTETPAPGGPATPQSDQ
jgi:hypothetical protein